MSPRRKEEAKHRSHFGAYIAKGGRDGIAAGRADLRHDLLLVVLGYSNVYQLVGGFPDWKAARLSLETQQP